jgi:methionine sulfoxide reductase heme-binding subunit
VIKDSQFNKIILFINAIVPLAMMGWDGYHRKLGANPLEFVIHTTGTMTLVFLTLTLAVTPLRRLTGYNSLIELRRMLGLFAFFYGTLHLLAYSGFDKSFNLPKIFEDVLNRQFIFFGMLSFLLMVPLAITSTRGMIRRIGGKRWAKLHRSVYYISLGGLLHYWMSVKADTSGPTFFACLIIGLLAYRIFRERAQRPAVNELKLK